MVHVHPKGHLGCLTLHPSADITLTATTRNRSARPLHPLQPGSPIPSVPVDNRGHATSLKNNPLQCLVTIKASWWCTNTFFFALFLSTEEACVVLGCRLAALLFASGFAPPDWFCEDYTCGTGGRDIRTLNNAWLFFKSCKYFTSAWKKTKLAAEKGFVKFSAHLKFLETEDCRS